MKKRASLVLILSLLGSASAQELYEAVKAGDLPKVRQIVERDPKIVNLQNQSGETILFGAIGQGKPEIVKYLISKGADVNHENNFHMAPLHLACLRNLPFEIVRLLVENGADVNAVSKYQGRPLDMAYESDNAPVIRYLTSKGAVPTALEFEIFNLAGGLHRLAYPWGMRNNLVVSTGLDGVLIVDTGFNKRALDTIRKIIAGFGRGDIRYVINTHSHWDHVAGNALAPSESAVIGLKKLEDLARQGRVARADQDRRGSGGKSLPAPYLLKFNGEEIEIFPYPGLHSDEDVLIHFPKAGVLCMGDLLLSQSCPAIREAAGYLELLDKVLDVFPAETTFVSGHGGDLDAAGLKKYRDDMAEMAEMVKKERDAGRTAEDMIRADLLKAYKPKYSHLDWLGPNSWIQTVVRGLASAATAPAQEIFDAIKNNDLAKVKALIEKESSLMNTKDQAGNTPLHHAAIIGSIPIVEFLFSKGADINASNAQQNTPLLESISNGKDDISIFLIEKGADIRKKNIDGSTSLHIAAISNRGETVKSLISKGIVVDAKDLSGFTPLNLMARVGNNVEIARLLIEKGADVNTKDNRNTTPLNNAGVYGRLEIIHLLLDYGADFDMAGELTNRLIFRAAELGSERLFKVVANKFGDSLFKNETQNKTLMNSALGGGSIDIVKILQAKGIPISFEPDPTGWNPLHYAASRNKPAMVEFLVRNGADIHARTNDGRSAYNIAEERGLKDMLSLILKLGGSSEPQKFPVLKGPYMGQVPPENRPKRFAPGIIEIDHTSISISPDGLEMAWGTGTSIMMSRVKNGHWTKPEYAPFSGKNEMSFYDDVPFFSPDNKRLFFTSRRPLGQAADAKENIWFVERTSSGWSNPAPVGDDVNGMAIHWQVSVSNSGTLYFGGNRDEDGYGQSDIYRSKIVKGEYSKPENLGPVINSKESETQPFISPDESYFLYVRIIERRPTPYLSFRSKDGQWLQPISLEKYLGKTGCLIVSPDGTYIFTQNGGWFSARFIEELRPKELK